jgi:hypothetical protein
MCPAIPSFGPIRSVWLLHVEPASAQQKAEMSMVANSLSGLDFEETSI